MERVVRMRTTRTKGTTNNISRLILYLSCCIIQLIHNPCSLVACRWTEAQNWEAEDGEEKKAGQQEEARKRKCETG